MSAPVEVSVAPNCYCKDQAPNLVHRSDRSRRADKSMLAPPSGFSWQDNASQAESLSWWSSGTPCPAYEPNISAEPACAVGFRWESDVLGRGRSMGSTGRVEKSLYAVHCVEIVQSSSLGEYASEIALQWYDSGRNTYRTLLKRQVGGGRITISYQGVLAAECQARLS